MRVFVTGATGFIGFAIVQELLAAGHEVTGLARSVASAKRLRDVGARVLLGSIEDTDCLRRGAQAADGAIHTAFYHKLSHIPLPRRLGIFLGGAPTGIVQRFMMAAVMSDRRAVAALGDAFQGSDRPLVATFATMAMTPGAAATEDQPYDPAFFAAPRAETEHVMHRLAGQGVRTSIIRLPPSVHGPGDQGFVPMLINIARKKKTSAYVGDGANRWPSVHRLDAARLFRLALESGHAGGTYHGVADEGIPFRDIAKRMGDALRVPERSLGPAEAGKHFGFLAGFVSRDNPTSSALTQARLGWQPTQPGLLSDLEHAGYFDVSHA